MDRINLLNWSENVIGSFLYCWPSCSQYPDIVIVEDDNEDEYAPVIQSGDQNEPARETLSSGGDGTSPLMSSAVQLNGSSSLTAEDPVTMMDSILNDNINLLGKWVLIKVAKFVCVVSLSLWSSFHNMNTCSLPFFVLVRAELHKYCSEKDLIIPRAVLGFSW